MSWFGHLTDLSTFKTTVQQNTLYMQNTLYIVLYKTLRPAKRPQKTHSFF